MKKFLSMLLTVCMLLSLAPMTAYAKKMSVGYINENTADISFESLGTTTESAITAEIKVYVKEKDNKNFKGVGEFVVAGSLDDGTTVFTVPMTVSEKNPVSNDEYDVSFGDFDYTSSKADVIAAGKAAPDTYLVLGDVYSISEVTSDTFKIDLDDKGMDSNQAESIVNSIKSTLTEDTVFFYALTGSDYIGISYSVNDEDFGPNPVPANLAGLNTLSATTKVYVIGKAYSHYSEDITLTMSDIAVGTKASDITVTGLPDGFELADICVFNSQKNPVTKVTEPGDYYVAIVVKTKDGLVFADDYKGIDEAWYDGNITVNGKAPYYNQLAHDYDKEKNNLYVTQSDDTLNVYVQIVAQVTVVNMTKVDSPYVMIAEDEGFTEDAAKAIAEDKFGTSVQKTTIVVYDYDYFWNGTSYYKAVILRPGESEWSSTKLNWFAEYTAGNKMTVINNNIYVLGSTCVVNQIYSCNTGCEIGSVNGKGEELARRVYEAYADDKDTLVIYGTDGTKYDYYTDGAAVTGKTFAEVKAAMDGKDFGLVLGTAKSEAHSCNGITFDIALGEDILADRLGGIFDKKDAVNAYLTVDTENFADSDEFYVPVGKTLNLCLHDHGLTNDECMTFNVYGTLNVYDCGETTRYFELDDFQAVTSTTLASITGLVEGVDYIAVKGGYITNSYKGGLGCMGIICTYDYEDYQEGVIGKLNLYSGNIIGCGEGAVECGLGSFHMYGGTIQGNTGESGAGVNNGASANSFHMHGGKIQYNTAWRHGGGVYNEVGDATFDGDCYVWNNQIADEDTGKVISRNNFETSAEACDEVKILGSGLASTSKIGVTLKEGSGKFATGAASNVPMFVSDVDIYGVRAVGNKLELYLNAQTDDGEITVPTNYDENNTTTKVVVSGDSNVEATGLDNIARELKSDNTTENVKIILTAKAQTEEQVGKAAETNAIKEELEDDEKVDFLVITLDSVVGTTQSAIHNTGANVVEVVIPYTLGDNTITGVFRYHDATVDEFTLDNTKSGAVNTYYYENGVLHIFSTKFSTYAVSYTEPTPTPPGPTPPAITTVDTDPDYVITAPDTTNGKITVSKKYASYGETIKITVTPDKGYTLETLTVKTSGGKEIDVTAVKLGSSYTFKMPSGNVTVTATFMEDNTMLNYFFDVTAKDYFYDAVLWAAENGITSGVDESLFRPTWITNRAQMVTFLWRAAGKPQATSKNNPFTDVKEGSYYYDAVLWGVENGVVKGTTTTTFSPAQEVTRGQAMAFIARFAGVKDEATGYTHGFTDVKSTSYYNNAISWASSNGITSGKTADTFGPSDGCQRAHVVVFLYNYFNK